MASTSYLPVKDAALAQWLTNFVAVANVNMSTLRLTPSDLASLQSVAQQFHNDITVADTAKQAAMTATHTKKHSRTQGDAAARTLVKRIQGIPNVPPTLIQQLGMTVPAPQRKVVPLTIPQTLQAVVQPTTQILLTWDINGNAPGTLYVMESKCGEAGTWTTINTQTAARMFDGGCTPGMTTYYRVSSKRGTRTSLPSAEAIVYSK